MKKTSLALAIAAAAGLSVQPAMAQDYQVEAGLNYGYIDYDISHKASDDDMGADLTYYFNEVETAGKPLAEAAFLGKNGNVSAYYTRRDVGQSGVQDIHFYGLSTEIWKNNFYVSAGLDETELDDGPKLAKRLFSTTNHFVKAGYMLNDNLLAYAVTRDGDDFDHPDMGVGGKYVAELGNNFVNLEAEIYRGQTDDQVFTGFITKADYFLTNDLSAGIRYRDITADGVRAQWGAGVKYFITPAVSAELEYATRKDLVDHSIGVRLAARF